ncbi:unnamed protein product [Vicia faba]|uniref:Glucose-methanol-choline oxidoreductase C-terminal domain-containing protein n=1 Tax=Vicia faba TaxID=3906 RepID=A0AAV0YKH6_VICFA|nr:unnamed protein product [Vicia faba]
MILISAHKWFNCFKNVVDVERCVNRTLKLGNVLRSRAMNDFKFRNWLGVKDFRFIGPALLMIKQIMLNMTEFCRIVITIWNYHGGRVVGRVVGFHLKVYLYKIIFNSNGSNSMGRDVRGRVVDSHLKVIGIYSLRFMDGYICSVSSKTNSQATNEAWKIFSANIERQVGSIATLGNVLMSRAMNDFKFRNWLGVKDFRFIGPTLLMTKQIMLNMTEFCRMISTIWNYHGGCVIGRVVDSHLKVIAIYSLRFMDGSVCSVSSKINSQATNETWKVSF